MLHLAWSGVMLVSFLLFFWVGGGGGFVFGGVGNGVKTLVIPFLRSRVAKSR